MLFDEYQENVEVYHQVLPVSGWGDPTWELVTTIKGRFEPIDGNEAFLQNQAFSDVTEVFITDYANIAAITGTVIALVDSEGIQRRVVGEPERWKWGLINSHAVAKCKRAQWEV